MAKRKRTTKKGPFLAAFAKLGNVTSACKSAKCSRVQVYAWLKDDPEFAKQFDEAQQEAMEHLEEEARRRAVTGTLKPVFYLGSQCGQIREYSDTLLIFLMKAGNPQKYRENSRVEHAGNVAVQHSGELKIQQREDWYGNNAHDRLAETASASGAGADFASEIQAAGVRQAMGQDGNGTALRN